MQPFLLLSSPCACPPSCSPSIHLFTASTELTQVYNSLMSRVFFKCQVLVCEPCLHSLGCERIYPSLLTSVFYSYCLLLYSRETIGIICLFIYLFIFNLKRFKPCVSALGVVWGDECVIHCRGRLLVTQPAFTLRSELRAHEPISG